MNNQTMIKVGIVGVSGYSGFTVLEYLLNHPQVRITYVSANNTKGPLTEIWPRLEGRTPLMCSTFNADEAAEKCDVLFLAVPHTVSMSITPTLLKAKKKIIDLSGDYRLASADLYQHWYGTAHTDSKNLSQAVYGLPELYREKIKSAQLISNPGCYPTAALLGLLPAAASFGNQISSIIIDAKSGTTGAGKKSTVGLSFSEVNENFKAYKPLNHQHSPEIEQYLQNVLQKSVPIDFVPHLLPVSRGILATIYLRLQSKIDLKKAHNVFKKFYKTEPFVRVLPAEQQPELKNVTATNFCDIGLAVNKTGELLVVTSAIDNLVKGAAGQAIQNMNIMCKFDETQGLL